MKKYSLIFVFLNILLNSLSSNDSIKIEKDFSYRSLELLKYVANEYAYNAPGRENKNTSVPDPEKYNWPCVIARMKLYGINDSLSNRRVELYKVNDPFHFTLIGFTRILFLYPDAPAIKKNEINYLNKVFSRIDSYNAFNGEGTENHLNMSRTSAYLIAQRAEKYPELFPDASLYKNSIKNWIKYYSKRIYQVGNGEWNSSTYNTFNLIGWLNLYDFSVDNEVKNMAKAVLDYYATDMAIHYSWGITGGAEMRGGSSNEYLNSISDFTSWIWYGDTNQLFKKSNYSIHSVHAATSNYRPPVLLYELARKSSNKSGYFELNRPSYLMDKSAESYEVFSFNQLYTISCSYNNFGGFHHGDYQVVNWKLILKGETFPVVFTGNGSHITHSGKFRSPWDQYYLSDNIFIQVTKVPKNFNSNLSSIANTG